MTSDKKKKFYSKYFLSEISLQVFCWIGIFALILLINKIVLAESSSERHGFKSGKKPTTTYRKEDFLDEDENEDDDDLNILDTDSIKQAPRNNISVGGEKNTGPDPVRTEKGIAVGGTPVNNNSKNNFESIYIDDDTAEGNQDNIITDFNFPDADIVDLAKTLGKLTGKNFILEKDVKGRISIISNSPVTVPEAWKAFLTALDVNGFAIIPSGKYLRIARQRDARDKQLKTYTGEKTPNTDSLITRIFTLKYINAEEVARTFRNFMPPNSRIIAYEQSNKVIVTDTGSNIIKLAKMLEILDIEDYDATIEVLPIKYASATEISKLVDTLIPGTSSMGVPGMPPTGGSSRFGSGKFSGRRTKEGGVIDTIIPDERTNTLIIHANAKGIAQVQELIAKLDQKFPSLAGGKVHVIYLQFADAEQISNTLNNISSNNSGRPPSGLPSTGSSGIGTNPISGSLFEGSIKVSPDKSTNALVVTASATDFATVKHVVNKLDIPRDQVYAEVTILEAQVDFNHSSSVNLAAPGSMLGSITNATDLTGLLQGNPFSSNGIVLGGGGGSPTNITINGQSYAVPGVAGLIKAIQGNTSTNILATPQIIALDNTEATFDSTEKLPVPQQNFVQGVGAQQTFTKESVSLTITLKPQINKITNFVKLDISAKQADIHNTSVPQSLQGSAFGTQERSAKTSVVIGDGDTVIMGGLMRNKTIEGKTKIPILGDIPILGWLFKSSSVQTTKNNLLIIITIKIIRQYQKIRDILDKKLKERDNFIEKNLGKDDPFQIYRDQMSKDLPDIEKLLQQRNTPAAAEDSKTPLVSTPGATSAPTTDAAPAVMTPPPLVPVGDAVIIQPQQPIPISTSTSITAPPEQPAVMEATPLPLTPENTNESQPH